MSDRSQSALLVLDMQQSIFDQTGSDAELLSRLQSVRSAAQEHGLLTVFVRVGFRPGHPEVGERNQMFGRIKAGGYMVATEPGSQILDELKPNEDDLVVVKSRVNSFHGTDLDLLLRAHNITNLVITGIATSAVVLTTVTTAADLDYSLEVLSDCCLDSDMELHEALMTKVFPRSASVMTHDAWIASL